MIIKQRTSILILSTVILGLSGLSPSLARAATHLVTITTDAKPGEVYGIDVNLGAQGQLLNFVYTDSKAAPITIYLRDVQHGKTKSLMDLPDRKNIITLRADDSFTPEKGGYAVLRYLQSGIWDTYRDFRMLVDIASTIVVRSEPDSNDDDDQDQFTGVFNSLFLEKNTSFLHDGPIGIKDVRKVN